MSAEAVVTQIIDKAIELADTNNENLKTYADAAAIAGLMIFTGGTAPNVSFTPAAIEPPVGFPMTAENNALSTFTTINDVLQAQATAALANYFATYFPLVDAGYTQAATWINEVLTIGGTGIKPEVEAQIWARARSRTLLDADRAQAEVISLWEGRGFPLPPGPATAQVMNIEQAAFNKAADESVARAVQQAQLEIENIRLAVDLAIKSRLEALRTAQEYIKTIMLPAEIAARVAGIGVNAQAALISAAANFYRARLERDQLILTAKTTNAGFQRDIDVKELAAIVEGAKARAGAAGQAAIAASHAAAAANSALNAIGNLANITNE